MLLRRSVIHETKWQLLLAFITTIFCATNTHAQINGNENGMRALPKAWGFYQGLMLRLDRVERKYPDLQASVFIARNEFKSAFPNFEANAERSFRSWGAKDKDIATMRTRVMDILPMIEREPIDRSSALRLVKSVRQQANGVGVPEETLQYLLATAFMDKPERELARRWITEYSSHNDPVSKSVTVLLKIPRSFKREDGVRPNIVSTWNSEAGNGLEMLMLSVANSDEKPLTLSAIDNDLRLGSKSKIRHSFNGMGQILSLQPFSQEGVAGYILDVQDESDRAGLKTILRHRYYFLFLPSRIVSLACQVGANRYDIASLKPKMLRFSKLCSSVANSLVLPQQYLDGG